MKCMFSIKAQVIAIRQNPWRTRFTNCSRDSDSGKYEGRQIGTKWESDAVLRRIWVEPNSDTQMGGTGKKVTPRPGGGFSLIARVTILPQIFSTQTDYLPPKSSRKRKSLTWRNQIVNVNFLRHCEARSRPFGIVHGPWPSSLLRRRTKGLQTIQSKPLRCNVHGYAWPKIYPKDRMQIQEHGSAGTSAFCELRIFCE